MPSLISQLDALLVKGHVTFAEQQISVLDLIKQAHNIRLQYPDLRQQKIALSYTNIEEFVVGLIAFDGWCSDVYLCPLNVLPLEVERIIKWPVDKSTINEGQAHKPLVFANDYTIQSIWHLATSGTTGTPKWFSHSFLSLTVSTKCSHNLQGLCWGLLYQPYRFAGLQVVLQALLSGADLVDVSNNEPLAQVKLLQQHQVTAMSATPSLWRQMLMTKQLQNLALSHMTLGGEIADQTLLDHLIDQFPSAKLRHIYASTEAGVGFVVTDGQAGFPVSWLGDSALPVTLKISDEQHLLVKPSHKITSKSTLQLDEHGYMDTQDQVQIIGDRVLFLGRATGTINVGGNKVHPEKVEQVLLQCTGISEAKVYAKKSPLMGELVVADVVLVDNAGNVDKASIKQQALKLCKNRLQRFEIPIKINVVDNIVHDLSGKLNRKLN